MDSNHKKIGYIGLMVLFIVFCIPQVYGENQGNITTDARNIQLQFNDLQEKNTINHEFSLSKSPDYTQIPEEGTIHHSSDGITRIFDDGGNQVSISDDADSPKKITTNGYLPVAKIYRVPADSFIRQEGNRTRVYANNKLIFTVIDENSTNPSPPLSAPSMAPDAVAKNNIDGGYMESATKDHLYNVRSFVADWNVPSPPHPTNASDHQTWLFNAVGENGAIAQPCIGYGRDLRWQGVAVYGYQDKYHYYYSDFLPIKTGDAIEGILMYYPDYGYWSIRLFDKTNGTISMNLSVETKDLLDNNDIKAFCSLEQYAVSNHYDLPGTTNFTNISIMGPNSNPISFTWDKEVNPDGLRFLNGLGVDSPSQSQVTLYTDKTFTISPSAGPGGWISPAANVSILSGDSYGDVTITPDQTNHYMIGNVFVDGNSVGTPTVYSFTNVTSDHTILAIFTHFFTVTPNAGLGGSIFPPSSINVPQGGNQTFNITPDTGYGIQDVVVSGVSKGPISSYTFTNVTGDNSISATFRSLSSTTPIADFTASPTSGQNAPLQVQFSDASTAAKTDQWFWNFGDGTTSTLQNPLHQYTANGTYSVSFTATNLTGGSDTKIKTNYITVGPLYTLADGTYTVVLFNSSGSTVWTPPTGVTQVDYLVVAGGGEGGAGGTMQSGGITYWLAGGGGGAGGLLNGSSHPITGAQTVVVGAGGSGSSSPCGAKGGDSSFGNVTSKITALGGGGGVGSGCSDTVVTSGGSGGGGSGSSNPRGTGILLQGHDGGDGYYSSSTHRGAGGGGGGALAAGAAASSTAGGSGGNGGSGTSVSITGTPASYAGGGGGGVAISGATAGTGGAGCGGDGSMGIANSVKCQGTGAGGGGAGGGSNSHGSGGSGIVIIRYLTPVAPVASFTGTPTNGTAPLTIQFTDTSLGNPTGWTWNFGDGNTTNSTVQNPVHTYLMNGIYTVSLNAANSGGGNTTMKLNYINVTSPVSPPVANFTATPTSGPAQLTVQFTDQSTGSPTSWTWAFRNSTTGWTQFNTTENPAYPFAGGSYDINLTVTNTAGSDDEIKMRYINVVIPLPGQTNPPTDPDGDGLYEDLNGNGELDFNDVQLFFRQMDWIASNEPISLFDFNYNNEIDFNDIQLLFRRI